MSFLPSLYREYIYIYIYIYIIIIIDINRMPARGAYPVHDKKDNTDKT